MVKKLVHDPLFLGAPCQRATKEDKAIAQDLLDTLAHHHKHCVGMAANMIGEQKRIIVFLDGDKYTVMYNPEIVSKGAPYETEESCLSLLGGERKTTRYKTVRVRYQDSGFVMRTKSFTGFVAQIIQHEVDHCNGVLI